MYAVAVPLALLLAACFFGTAYGCADGQYEACSADVLGTSTVVVDGETSYKIAVSPNGNYLAYKTTDEVKVVDLVNGNAVTKIDKPGLGGQSSGLSYYDDDWLVVALADTESTDTSFEVMKPADLDESFSNYGDLGIGSCHHSSRYRSSNGWTLTTVQVVSGQNCNCAKNGDCADNPVKQLRALTTTYKERSNSGKRTETRLLKLNDNRYKQSGTCYNYGSCSGSYGDNTDIDIAADGVRDFVVSTDMLLEARIDSSKIQLKNANAMGSCADPDIDPGYSCDLTAGSYSSCKDRQTIGCCGSCSTCSISNQKESCEWTNPWMGDEFFASINGAFASAAFSPDNTQLAALDTSANELVIYNIANADAVTEEARYSMASGHTADNDVAYSADGKYVYVSGETLVKVLVANTCACTDHTSRTCEAGEGHTNGTSTSDTSCDACANNEVSPGGQATCTACGDGQEPNSDQSACDCAAGFASPEGSDGACAQCVDGKTPNAAKNDCDDCAAGFAGTNGACAQCVDGKTPNAAKNDCDDCAAGFAGVNGTCSECVSGTEPNANSTECVAVVLNSAAPSLGSAGTALGTLSVLWVLSSMFGPGKF